MSVRIGITCSFEDWPDDEGARERLCHYVLALEDAGAQGEILFLNHYAPESAAQLGAQLDGLLVSGGSDLHPAWYGEEPHEGANLVLVPPARPVFEKALCDAFAARDKPIFGICYGCQFLNVWAGGGIVQDIPLQWPDCIAHKATRHEVRVSPDSALARVAGKNEFEVNSFHHQGIGRVAPGVRAVAQASDGIIEALELPGAFMRGVQWHPERDRADVITGRLFGDFIAACR